MHFLLRKLSHFISLDEEEKRCLTSAIGSAVELPRGTEISREQSQPAQATIILSGVACRYKMTRDGKRQIIAFQIPGDISDAHSYLLPFATHALGTLSRCYVAYIPHRELVRVCERLPRLGLALWRNTLIDAAMYQVWLLNIGHRDAISRVSHLICELVMRYQAVGLLRSGNAIEMPITQLEIGDATGLSAVHVNRTLSELRSRNIISKGPHTLAVLDWDKLREIGGFDGCYLNLSGSLAYTPATESCRVA
jgi:CRP-like cAMP-binding protein